MLPLALMHNFNPRDLAGCQTWLDAKTIGLANATSLTTWSDLSGKANDYTQATSTKRPTFYTGSGTPYVRFDGIDDALQNTTNLGLTQNIGGITIAIAQKYRSIGTGLYNDAFCAVTGTSSTLSRVVMGISLNGNYHIGGRRLDTDGFAMNEGQTASANFAVVQVGYLDFANASARVFANGGANAATTFQTAGNTSNTASLGMYLGSKNSTELAYTDMYEVAIYNRVLTNAEITLITRYLGARWGIYVAT